MGIKSLLATTWRRSRCGELFDCDHAGIAPPACAWTGHDTLAERHLRQLRWLAEELGGELIDPVVVRTGRDAYREGDGMAVLPAALLGPRSVTNEGPPRSPRGIKVGRPRPIRERR